MNRRSAPRTRSEPGDIRACLLFAHRSYSLGIDAAVAGHVAVVQQLAVAERRHYAPGAGGCRTDPVSSTLSASRSCNRQSSSEEPDERHENCNIQGTGHAPRASRRRRQGDRARHLRRRLPPARHAARQGAAQPARPRTHPRHRHQRRGGARRRVLGSDGRRLPVRDREPGERRGGGVPRPRALPGAAGRRGGGRHAHHRRPGA